MKIPNIAAAAILSIDFSSATVIGVLIAIVVVIVLLCVGCICIYYRGFYKNRRQREVEITPTDKKLIDYYLNKGNTSTTGYDVQVDLQTTTAETRDSVGSHDEEAPRPPERSPPPSNRKLTKIELSNSWYTIDYDELENMNKIGEGSYGIVYHANWRDQEVAVKRFKELDKEQRDNFSIEASIMITVKPHKNVIKLFGICHNPDKPLAIITEFMEMGSLKDLLRNTRITPIQLVTIARDIARGLQHLHREKIVHRDLSARNILCTNDGNGFFISKVADFGLSRILGEAKEGYTKSSTGPLRWLAPECLLEKKYSEQSDIWGYGCVLVEILSGGLDPYPEQADALHVAAAVMLDNAKPGIPEKTPLKLANVMETCFSREPEMRPDFKTLIEVLDDVENDIKSNPFY